MGVTPEGSAEGGAGQPGAERVDGEAGFSRWVDVGDERGAGDLLELRRQRGGECEDVGDDDVRPQLANERERVGGGLDDGLVEVEGLGTGGEDLVLGRRGEGEALGLDVLPPARPGLKRDVVPARRERPPEGDHGEGVPWVAEGAEQRAHV